jgi:hypothetical protein
MSGRTCGAEIGMSEAMSARTLRAVCLVAHEGTYWAGPSGTRYSTFEELPSRLLALVEKLDGSQGRKRCRLFSRPPACVVSRHRSPTSRFRRALRQRPNFAINLKRSIPNLQLSTRMPADHLYPRKLPACRRPAFPLWAERSHSGSFRSDQWDDQNWRCRPIAL